MRLSSIKASNIHPSSKIESGSNIVNVHMDRHSFCGHNCEISNAKIGAFTSISDNVIIGGGTHPVDWVSMSPVFYKGRDSVRKKYAEHHRPEPLQTGVGHDVWIGHGVHIKQGVEIGTGAVVGMGSIVTKDVEPYAIVAGCPAKLIRKRFDDNLVKLLLESQWWMFEDKKLMEYAKDFNDPLRFIERVQQ